VEKPTRPEGASSWRQRISPLVQLSTWHVAAPTPEEEEAYWEDQRQSLLNWGLSLLLLLIVIDLVWWPSDLVFFRGEPNVIRAFSVTRGCAAALAVFLWLLTPRVELVRRHPFVSMTVSVGLVALVGGYEFGGLGGPGTLWFHLLPYVVLSPVALIFGYFGLHPEYLADRRAGSALSFVVAIALFSILSGVLTDRLRRQTFFLRRATERQATELRDLNEHLETRVRAQTSELRELASHLDSARESERASIARELHDELGQDLSALRYALKFARLRFEKEPAAIGSSLEEMEELLRRTTQTTRTMLAGLRPTVLEDLGLSAAAEWLVKRMQERTGVVCDLQLPPEELLLPLPLATAAYRVLQESLTNVARHAQAHHVHLLVEKRPDSLDVTVTDDGIGFTRSPSTRAGGVGLIWMRERVQSLGGTLELDTAPGRGTRLTARLPTTLAPEVAA